VNSRVLIARPKRIRESGVMATGPTQHVIVDGMRLRYLDTGPVGAAPDATLPLVVIPGHTARIEGFDAMVPALAAHRRVIVVDFPGSGYSAKPDREYTLEFYEDTLMALLDALGIDQAIPTGGSLGGNLVLRLGHRFPERFPRLVVWAPGGAWTARPWLASLTRRLMGRRTFWPSVAIQSRFWYERDFPGRRQALDETFAYYREVMSPGFVAMYWGLAADQVGHSLFDIATGIAQPTLLCWGDQDNGANMGDGVARLRTLLPNCEFHTFAGARHSLETEIPLELAQRINDFVSTPTIQL